ncbi:MAG: nucleotidyl transferase AbiEii/AbiGii toxin family protein [Actinomycetales bacterium]
MTASSLHPEGGQIPWRQADPDTFAATVLAAADQLGVQSLAVEKDYWVCQALRAIERHAPGQVIFKGGTSLEKLRIIQRFSEDLDLLVVSSFGSERQGKTALREICHAAAAGTGANLTEERSGGRLGSLHRRAYLSTLLTTAAEAPGLADPDRILLELGQSGGAHPSRTRRIESLLTRQLQRVDFDVSAFPDLAPFDVPVLDPGRTLIEKLLRMNNFAEMAVADRAHHTWPRIGRQFYDVWALLGDSDVLAFLADTARARAVLEDCIAVSRDFGEDRPAPSGGFALSAVFDPAGPDAARLRREHDAAMGVLYYGTEDPPSFDEVLARVRSNTDLLDFEA